MNVKVMRLKNGAHIPTSGSKESAGCDLYACIDDDVIIYPNRTVMIGTGLSFELPDGTFGAIVARSGMATKRGLAPANKIGVCDSDYRWEYIVALHNHSDEKQIIRNGDRIAQMIVLPYVKPLFEESELSSTDRGGKGFGSTGIR